MTALASCFLACITDAVDAPGITVTLNTLVTPPALALRQSLIGMTCAPRGRLRISGPLSPTIVGPPRQLLVPPAREPSSMPAPPLVALIPAPPALAPAKLPSNLAN